MSINYKLSKKVILVANFASPNKCTVKVFSSHEKKRAKEHLEWIKRCTPTPVAETVNLDEGMIEVSNSNFEIFLTDIQSRYYGAEFLCRIYSKEFEKFPGWRWGERMTMVKLDIPGITSILTSTTVIDGKVMGKYCIDTHTKGWYLESTRLLSMKNPDLAQYKKNYDEYWETKKTAALEPGSVYIDRWGVVYLNLASNIYSKLTGYGYNNYRVDQHWYNNTCSNPIRANMMLEVDRDVLTKTVFNLNDLETLIKEYYEKMTKTNSHRANSCLRIKKASSGKFAKIGELKGYKKFYSSTKFEILLEAFIKGRIHAFKDNETDLVDPLKLYDERSLFSIFKGKTVSKMSDYISQTYLKLIKSRLAKKKLDGPAWREADRFKFFYNPTSELTEDEVISGVNLIADRGNEAPTLDELITMGVIKNIDEFKEILDSIRGWKKLE